MIQRPLKSVAVILLGLICCSPAVFSAQSQLIYGAMIYVASAPGDDLGSYLTAELAKHKLPVLITPERRNANYVLAGFVQNEGIPVSSADASGKQKPKTIWQGKLVLADAQTRTVAWSAEFHGPCPPCDADPDNAEHFLAGKFVKRFQHDLFTKRSLSDRIDDFSAP
jgi:hypothetical protein